MRDKVILAIYPNGKGLSYIVMEKNYIIGFGNVVSNPICNAKLLGRAERLMDYYNADSILLPKGNHGDRILLLLGCLKKIIEHYGKEWFEYTREQIRFVFEQFEAKSKYEIAKELVKQFPELENRMPKKRGTCDPIDYNMGLFDAMSLVVCWKYNN